MNCAVGRLKYGIAAAWRSNGPCQRRFPTFSDQLCQNCTEVTFTVPSSFRLLVGTSDTSSDRFLPSITGAQLTRVEAHSTSAHRQHKVSKLIGGDRCQD